MNKTPTLIVETFDAVWGAYLMLADSAGHVPVRDRYHRRWVLVEVTGRLRSRRAFVRDTPQVNDSPDIYGLIDVDSRAVLSAHDLIDAHGLLTVEPTHSPVPMPLHLGYSDLPLCARLVPRAVGATGSESLV
ncbi:MULTISPECIES: hypothetical protein [Rhodococcus]|uniref:Uncharacterized protein n=1 Tax=Rhodococcus qingshengii JCM 15477 TaxID=1303681 RepID=A0AB38RNM1_RHOSG|nr:MULTISPECIES: hypothetical protein [Rhodococcus]MDA3637502.1 hypothetical protein [Rhodococcus sp. C-2]UPU46684.1 hypothetical protein M0639_31215 [Rhodococcus qingshengii JCM 15477]